MKRKIFSASVCVLTALAVAVLAGCASAPLASWHDRAPAKTALTEYIEEVTDPCSPDYIPVENRIAVFDFDGTLFLETDPTYFDWQLFEHRVLEDPSYKATDEQLAAARASRQGKFPKLDKNRERMVAEAYRGMTVDEFYAFVRKFMAEDQPGFNGLKRGDAYYRPMLEVIDYLRHGLKGGLPKLCEILTNRTVQYARRQLTWFKHQHPGAQLIEIEREEGAVERILSSIHN